MKLFTKDGIINTSKLPDTYEPCFCASCGDRIGWVHEETTNFIGICDYCAVQISHDKNKDPMEDN